MEFLNIGVGEILVLIVLALILFGPEDIISIMRTVGKYTRAAQRMWAEVATSLQQDYLPEEVKDIIGETKTSVKEVKDTLKEVKTSVEAGVAEISRTSNQEIVGPLAAAQTDLAEIPRNINEGITRPRTKEAPNTAPKQEHPDVPAPGERADTL
jgi:Tat protein translocase TatB subunit